MHDAGMHPLPAGLFTAGLFTAGLFTALFTAGFPVLAIASELCPSLTLRVPTSDWSTFW